MKRGHKNSHNDLSPEFIRETFDYDPISGSLCWKARLSKRVHVGDEAGVIDDQGRRKIGELGHFNRIEDARDAYVAAAIKIHGPDWANW